MLSVWMFRHAESKMNLKQGEFVGGQQNHIELSPKGREQSRKLGQWISRHNLRPDIIFTSEAVRAQHTARISLATAGIYKPLHTDARLNEMTQGIAENRRRAEVYTAEVVSQIAEEQLDFKLEGGQSMNDVADLMDSWMSHVRTVQPEGQVFAFGHGLAFRCHLGRMLGWTHADIRDNPLPDASAIHVEYDDRGKISNYAFAIPTFVS